MVVNKKRSVYTMKRILICLFSLLVIANICFAKEISNADDQKIETKKVSVALLYVNNSKTTYDDELNKKMMENFDSLLKNYNVIHGGRYVELLNKTGIADIATAERTDIIEAFKGEDIDYVLFAELQPFVRKERITFFSYGIDMTGIVPIKIIDLKNNKYLYNGKFTEFASASTMMGSIGNKSVSLSALDKVIEKMNAVIKVRLPITSEG